MRKLILEELTLKNFRGVKNLTIQFNDDTTTISGGNNTGKSTIMNAFMWLLFGKDAEDRKDFNIKRLVNGQSIPKAETEVTAVLRMGGERITLRRAFVEKWSRPTAQTTEVFKGNETETSYNDVPMNVTEYQRRIKEIVDDSVFKMITNPLFFANMKWELQREYLFRLAGAVSDADIASRSPEYADLLDQISGKSLSDFRREIAAKKKKTKELLDDIQPRIDQTVKLMPEERNFDEIEEEIKTLSAKIKEIDEAITDVNKSNDLRNNAIQELTNKKNRLKHEQQNLMYMEQSKQNAIAQEANEQRRVVKDDIKFAERAIKVLEDSIYDMRLHVERRENDLKILEKKTADLRELWHTENARTYAGELTCSSCGQPLPKSMVERAEEAFNIDKQRRLGEITSSGKTLGNSMDALNKEIDLAKNGLSKYEIELNEKKKFRDGLVEKLSSLPAEVLSVTVVPSMVQGFKELDDQIYAIDEELIPLQQGKSVPSELHAERYHVGQRLDFLKSQLRDRETIKQYKKEIERLEEEGKNLAQLKADYERTEFTIKSFTKTKIDECEKRINSLFSYVRFKLFDYTQDGNEYETCVPLVDGVPFPVANTAGKLNAGLDIINVLTEFYGIAAPIFIDNREGVIEIIPTKSQIVNLEVNRFDHKLTVK